MKDGWLSSAVGLLAVRGRERFGDGEQRSSLYRLFNVEDRAKWEARSGGAFPKRAVRRNAQRLDPCGESAHQPRVAGEKRATRRRVLRR